MACIIMKMSSEAQRLYKSDYGTQWREYLNPSTLLPVQMEILEKLGVVFRGFEGIDNIVLGTFTPSLICDSPLVIPLYFDFEPTNAEIWQILERMADTYDAAKAACTPLPPPPPEKVRKNVQVIVPGLDDSE